jgi:hypothetical protein
LKCPAWLQPAGQDEPKVALEIVDASLHGFLARADIVLPPRTRGSVRVILGKGLCTTEQVTAVRQVEYDDAAVVTLSGEGRPLTLVGVSRFEIVRSRLGRRSRAQVLAYEWTESPTDDELAMWFAFGPSDVDIVE